jgi:predicted aconitase with swiveling domain
MCEIAVNKVVRGEFSAVAIVSSTPLSFFGEVDASSGVVVGARSDIIGQKLAGKVLCLPNTYGSNGAWRVIQLLAKNACGPVAIVISDAPDPSVVQGAILASMPIVRLETAADFGLLKSGQLLHYSGNGRLTLVSQGACEEEEDGHAHTE